MTTGRGKGKGYALQYLQVEWDPPPPFFFPFRIFLRTNLGGGIQGMISLHEMERWEKGRNQSQSNRAYHRTPMAIRIGGKTNPRCVD